MVGKRSDGYHLLDSLVVFLPDLCDSITLEQADALTFNASGMVPEDAKGMDNLVVKAANALASAAGRTPEVKITLHKNIPAGAGLGGGSADAAAAIKGLEQLWGLSLDDDLRNNLLLSLGADVPVCYHAKPCRFEGVGDIISDIPALPSFFLLLVWPDCHTATKEVFGAGPLPFRQERLEMPHAFSQLDALVDFLAHTGNDLQAVAERLNPPIAKARRLLEQRAGCRLARMSGSGSCVFGIFADEASCKAARESIQNLHPSWWTHTGVV